MRIEEENEGEDEKEGGFDLFPHDVRPSEGERTEMRFKLSCPWNRFQLLVLTTNSVLKGSFIASPSILLLLLFLFIKPHLSVCNRLTGWNHLMDCNSLKSIIFHKGSPDKDW